tara:strand:+ start:107 stop:427 length:321 start_codon:yes stop_codon:yes gene_type:complete
MNTDNYEGHTPAKEWGDIVYADGYLPIFLDDDVYATDLDRQLMADAPLLLEEVKRLREELIVATDNMNWLDEIAEKKEREVDRLREAIKAYLDLEIETHELKELIE